MFTIRAIYIDGKGWIAEIIREIETSQEEVVYTTSRYSQKLAAITIAYGIYEKRFEQIPV